MKTFFPRRKPNGFALILVMIVILLAATMAAFFLSSAARERRAVSLYAGSSEVRHLAGAAVNRVMGQVSAATKEGTATDPVSWASQPGMIRTYAADGDPSSIYKLYSWDSLVESGVGFDPSAAGEVPPSDWKSKEAEFVDLNQAISGVFPVVDPAAAGVVEGFRIDGSNAAVAGSGLAAPMPVRWLYMLEDGQMVSPGAQTGSSVAVAGATTANPIVGRVAFWTDDETSKVNINTASEGAFWDWPKGASKDEMQFAGNPPVKGEMNRIPGHPAMTSMSAVFPDQLTADRWGSQTSYRTEMESLLELSPRVNWGGSLGGTYPITNFDFAYSPAGSVTTPGPVTAKTERLYVSPDELLFSTNTTGSTRTQHTQINPTDLKERGFFLTATSKAPETTLFETPRISLWPITWPHDSAYFRVRSGAPTTVYAPDTTPITSNDWMTAEDKLLAFCATLNASSADDQRYFVQRMNPDSPVDDWNNITRNQSLFRDYLRDLTAKPFPGYGGSFADKYTASGRDAIATKIFDHIRSNVNQISTSASPAYSFTGASLNVGSSDVEEPQAFSVVPIQTDMNTTGLGNFPTLREVAVVFFATSRVVPVFTGTGDKNDPSKWTNLIDVANGQVQTTEMQAAVLLDFLPSMGADMGQTPTFWVKITQGSFSAAGTSVSLAGKTVQWSSFIGRTSKVPVFAGLFRSKTNASDRSADPVAKTFDPNGNSVDNWSLISSPIAVSDPAFTFSSGQPLIIELYGLDSSNPSLDTTGNSTLKFATYEVDFSTWNGSIPTPLAPRWTVWDYPSVTTAAPVAPPASFEIPDPAFKADPSGPMDHKWVGTEIAPLLHPYMNIAATSRVRPYTTRSGFMASYVYGNSDAGGAAGLSTNFENRVNTTISQTSAANPYNYVSKADGTVSPYVQGSNVYVYPTAIGLITPFDSVISMVASAAAAQGDPRVIEQKTFVKVTDVFASGVEPRDPLPRTEQPNPITRPAALRDNRQYHTIGSYERSGLSTGFETDSSMIAASMGAAATEIAGAVGGGIAGNRKDWSSTVKPISHLTGLSSTPSVGDWSSNPGGTRDGGTLVRPDQNYEAFYVDPNASNRSQTPYFSEQDLSDTTAPSYFSPNRQIPSPVILGSIPRSTTTGWETLAFSPNPAKASHPGLGSPSNDAPDHLWLDLFWMPVAEPYPISDQFSTAGKVNLNYEIAPFNYIERKTAMYAALKSTWMTALSNGTAEDYKSPFYMRTVNPTSKTRYPLEIEETLSDFDAKFDGGDIFRSASQICEMFLVPEGETLASAKSGFWTGKELTSDTAREQPYDHLYSRITTKSNTFTVHWRVQALRKSPGTDPAVWQEGRDRVVAELRGATLIERFIDPNATNIPDYATNTSAEPLGNFYKWRVVSENFFQP